MFFSVVIIVLSKLEPDNGQCFQVFCSALTTFAGAFVGRMVPSKKPPTPTDIQPKP
jgi:hypothetical protein